MSGVPLHLVIGDKNLSSWSLRAWLVLRQANIPFEEHLFRFAEPAWRERVVALSPSGRVPALRHGDLVVCDSLAICEYVAELHPDRALWPVDRAARAFARSASAEIHSGFAQLRTHHPMNVAGRIPALRSQETEAEIARIQRLWCECRTRFGAGGPFLFGRFGIADAMFAPVVWRFRTYGVPLPDEHARGWYETMLELPAMKEWERAAEAEVREGHAFPEGFLPDPRSAQDCFAVIFSSQLTSPDVEGYGAAADAMVELAKKQPGYLGIESARNPDGSGITVSYWESLEAIAAWKANAEHRKTQARGRETFYARYEVRVCRVERGTRFG